MMRKIMKERQFLYESLTDVNSMLNNEGRKRVEEDLKSIDKLIPVLQKYDFDKETEEIGRLLLVDIPDDDVLIRKGAMFKDQPIKVQNGILNVLNEIQKELKRKPITREQLLKETEPVDYNYISDFLYEYAAVQEDNNGNAILVKRTTKKPIFGKIKLSPMLKYSGQGVVFDEVTSKLLNKYGVKGVSYNGQIDGECVVVFDNKAIDIIDKFKKEEGKWVSVKPPSQKQELTDMQKQRVERKL